jgi:hypothetical protein
MIPRVSSSGFKLVLYLLKLRHVGSKLVGRGVGGLGE